MTEIKYTILLLVILCNIELVAQDTLNMKEVYIKNDLIYKFSDDQHFTGVTQLKRRNGQVYFEEVYKDGVILFDYQYFKGVEKKICYRNIYNQYKPWIKEKEYYFPESGKWTLITSFDKNGKKILVEQFEKGKVTYSCEYSGKKKHGQQFCFDDDGNKMSFQYVNGKKVKEKKRGKKQGGK